MTRARPPISEERLNAVRSLLGERLGLGIRQLLEMLPGQSRQRVQAVLNHLIDHGEVVRDERLIELASPQRGYREYIYHLKTEQNHRASSG